MHLGPLESFSDKFMGPSECVWLCSSKSFSAVVGDIIDGTLLFLLTTIKNQIGIPFVKKRETFSALVAPCAIIEQQVSSR